MKRIAMMLVAGSVLFGAGLAQADDDWHPRCRIHEIEEHMNRAIGEIKQSPAMGHAGGHYGRHRGPGRRFASCGFRDRGFRGRLPRSGQPLSG